MSAIENTNSAPVDPKAAGIKKNFMRPRSFGDNKKEPSEFEERVIEVRRVARTVKGGRRIRFRALIVIGNRKGKIGVGMAKANDVAEAVRKAVAQAKKKLSVVPIVDGTIPYEVTFKFGSAVVMLKPAAAGTSIVAGGAVRAVAELAGITDLLGKMMGSPSKVNNIIATVKALSSFKPEYTNKIQSYVDKKIAAPVITASTEKTIEAEVNADIVAEAKADEPAKKVVKKSETKKAAKKSMK